MKRMKATAVGANLLAAIALFGCDSGGSGASPASGDAGSNDPLYALDFIVFGTDQSSDTTYVNTFGSLGITKVDPTQARPFVGDADLATYGGDIFVSSSESPEISKFSVDDSGTWTDEGTVSFANYGVQSVSVQPFTNTFVSATKAYLMDPNSGIQIIWNPQTMTITGTIQPPSSPAFVRQGYTIDGSPGAVRGNRMYRTVYWDNSTDSSFTTEQYLAVYDTDADALLTLTPEARCPALGGVVTQDEAGNLYFSNWWNDVQATLLDKEPTNCALRIPTGSDDFDPDWTLPYKSMTGGHEAAELQYIGSGKGVFAVFHDEDVTIDASTMPSDIFSSQSWSWWSVDFNARTAAPIDGLPLMLGGDVADVLDGRTFLIVPTNSWSTAEEYELMADGTVQDRFQIPGWGIGEFVKVR